MCAANYYGEPTAFNAAQRLVLPFLFENKYDSSTETEKDTGIGRGIKKLRKLHALHMPLSSAGYEGGMKEQSLQPEQPLKAMITDEMEKIM